MVSTAKAASNINGSELYQQRARLALPILVRQAIAGNQISYSQLALELDMANPRTLNYPLGSIGASLEDLSKELDISIPPIQCLVVSRKNGLPGEGIGWFLRKIVRTKYEDMPLTEKRDVVKLQHEKIYEFKKWPLILERLGLKQIDYDFSALFKNDRGKRGGGEGVEHKNLKAFISKNPSLIKIKTGQTGKVEIDLLSGDKLDVSFELKKEWVAVEVKSRTSNDHDISRGLFQCVKYQAVMEATVGVLGVSKLVRCILVVERKLTMKLIKLSHMLDVEVVEVQKSGQTYSIL